MTRLEALIALRCVVADGGVPTTPTIHAAFSDFLNADHGFTIGRLIYWIMDPDEVRAMGAAKVLHEAVLPGWDAAISIGACHVSLSEPIGSDPVRGWYPGPAATSATPARAWLLAILDVLIARAQEA